MKTNLNTLFLLTALLVVNILTAQTNYNINSNTTYSAAGIPATCNNCRINIADGVTLTIDQDVFFKNVSIIGGAVSKSTIVVDSKKVTFWATGSFSNIIGTFSNTANLVNSATVTFTNSTFTFSQNSFATVYTSISLVGSTWKLLGDAYLESTGGTFSIQSGSLIVGDGTAASKAYAKFNGGQLSLLDATSFVSIANNNNYYFNWSNYNGNGTSRKTTNNNLNCGAGKNACSAPVLYGPATLGAAGVSNSAILPVKLTSFNVKANANNISLTWITAQEINAESFEIERSIDGIHWTFIGKVAAKGNSSLPSSYSYADAVKGNGVFNYRLKMVDQDKKFEYSSIKSVSVNNIQSANISTYPNPATAYFVVDAHSASTLQLQIVNMNGAIVKYISGYTSNTKVSLSDVRSGNYVVKVTDAHGASQTFKLIVAR